MAKILVTGASGLLGANAILDLAEEHRVVGVYHEHSVSAPGVRCIRADLSQTGQADDLLAQERPDWVIHCAAATNVDECEKNPDMAARLNRDMAGYVAHACRSVGARLAHMSTDLVFDGDNGPYTEVDEVHPINIYGQSKLDGERMVREADHQALIVRTNIYGWNAQPKFSLAEWFLDRLQTTGEAPGFTDVTSTPILVNDLIGIVVKMLASPATGLFHVAGRDCLSKFDFGRRIAETFGLKDFNLLPTSVDEAGLAAPRPKNICLQTSKIVSELELKMPGVEQGLARFRRLLDTGYVERLKKLPGGNDGNE